MSAIDENQQRPKYADGRWTNANGCCGTLCISSHLFVSQQPSDVSVLYPHDFDAAVRHFDCWADLRRSRVCVLCIYYLVKNCVLIADNQVVIEFEDIYCFVYCEKYVIRCCEPVVSSARLLYATFNSFLSRSHILIRCAENLRNHASKMLLFFFVYYFFAPKKMFMLWLTRDIHSMTMRIGSFVCAWCSELDCA